MFACLNSFKIAGTVLCTMNGIIVKYTYEGKKNCEKNTYGRCRTRWRAQKCNNDPHGSHRTWKSN